MSSLDFKRCRSCHTVGTWQPSQARSFIETRVLTLFGISPFRCGTCRRRIMVFGNRRHMSSHRGVSHDSAPVASIPPQEDEDFQRLIAELRRSEKTLEENNSP